MHQLIHHILYNLLFFGWSMLRVEQVYNSNLCNINYLRLNFFIFYDVTHSLQVNKDFILNLISINKLD
jgi:hypothetical protein